MSIRFGFGEEGHIIRFNWVAIAVELGCVAEVGLEVIGVVEGDLLREGEQQDDPAVLRQLREACPIRQR